MRPFDAIVATVSVAYIYAIIAYIYSGAKNITLDKNSSRLIRFIVTLALPTIYVFGVNHDFSDCLEMLLPVVAVVTIASYAIPAIIKRIYNLICDWREDIKLKERIALRFRYTPIKRRFEKKYITIYMVGAYNYLFEYFYRHIIDYFTYNRRCLPLKLLRKNLRLINNDLSFLSLTLFCDDSWCEASYEESQLFDYLNHMINTLLSYSDSADLLVNNEYGRKADVRLQENMLQQDLDFFENEHKEFQEWLKQYKQFDFSSDFYKMYAKANIADASKDLLFIARSYM